MKNRTGLMRSPIPLFSSGPARSNINPPNADIYIYNIIMWAIHDLPVKQKRTGPACDHHSFWLFSTFLKNNILHLSYTFIGKCNIQDDSFLAEHSTSIGPISTEGHRVLCNKRITLYTKCDDPPPTTSR